MALSPRLDLRQSQQLVLTPQLQQAIKLLQLSNLELSEFIGQEIEKNPLLELSDGQPERVPGDTTDEPDVRPQTEGELSADQGLGESDISGGDGPLDTDFAENVYNHDSPTDQMGGNGQLGLNGSGAIRGGGGDIDGLEQSFETELSLQDHLRQQMPMIIQDAQGRLIAAHLIDLVDEAGYLQTNLEGVAQAMGCELDEAEGVLADLQTLEPTGVFARDLKECLALQLSELDRLDPCMAKLLDHLDLLARRDMAALKRLCRVDEEDLFDMIREVRALNPKPGLAFGSTTVQPVVPDVFVRKSPTGLWTVELNSDTLPKVLVNNSYYAELCSLSGNKKDKQYLSDCLSTANWLAKALDQRARTILKVSMELVRQQEAFFSHGVRHLKPLTLKDIADAIEMHESTVSRVTANKFMATNRGIYELKYFFTAAIAAADGGDAHSAESVRSRIKDLIDAEEPKKILSDDQLVKLLKDEGVDVARRTVAKYREAMKIPSSVQRRRLKNMPSL